MQRLLVWHEHLLSWMIAESGVRNACEEFLRTHLSHPMANDAAIAEAGRIIEVEAVDRWIGPDKMLSVMQHDLLRIIDHVYTNDGRGDGVFQKDVYDKLLFGAAGSVTLEDANGPFKTRREAMAWSEQLFAHISTMIHDQGSAYLSGKDATLAHIGSVGPELPLAEDLGPVYVRAAQMARRFEVTIAGARTVLVLERYRLANEGEPPAGLDDLADLLPEELRRDPLSGEPWAYVPERMQSDEYGDTLLPGALAWPYTLRAPSLPGMESPAGYARHPSAGLLITHPIQGPKYDEIEQDSGNG
ncbi:MAG: hypothetical protein HRU13_12575 [Phycisphaerales bacterium]|nr:hypothetical protein [Phycisphaerales bacterium]